MKAGFTAVLETESGPSRHIWCRAISDRYSEQQRKRPLRAQTDLMDP